MKKMGNLKKAAHVLSASAVAAATIFGSTATAFAANNTVTLPEGKTYDVYQVFTGTVAEGKLQSAKWGADVKGEGKTAGDNVAAADLKTLSDIAEDTNHTDADVVSALKNMVDLDGTPNGKDINDKSLDNATDSVSLTDGYYVFADVTETAADKNGSSFYVAQVVGGEITSLTQKNALPTVDKQVSDETTADGVDVSDTTEWSDDADHQIGEGFRFKLIATIPDNAGIDEYEHYFLQFNDTQSAGVTFDGIASVKVYDSTNSEKAALNEAATGGYTKTAEGNALTVVINDLKAVAAANGMSTIRGAKVEVIYNAHLNADAKTTESGLTNADKNGSINHNTVSLTYSNNPSWDGTGKPGTDTTTEDTVWVTSLNLPVLKTGNAGEALDGVTFELYDAAEGGSAIEVVSEGNGTYRVATSADQNKTTTLTTAAGGQIVIRGLEGKQYYLEEKTTLPGYKKLEERVAVTLKSTETEAADGASVSTTVTRETASNAASINDAGKLVVVNQSSSNLPSTGGQGTTLILIIGAAAVAGGLVLKSRRKMAESSFDD